MAGDGARPAGEVRGAAIQTMISAISPSLLPGEHLGDDQILPTSLLRDLFGPDEDWRIRGQEVGATLLRDNHLRGSMNTERVLRVITAWLTENHPGADDVHVIQADHRGVDLVVRLDYPSDFLLGMLQRIAWETKGRDVIQDIDDVYRFHVIL